jgi:hypothetical protein
VSLPIAALVRPRPAVDLGLPATTPRIVVDRLRPFFQADPDFAAGLRVQLDAARAEIFAKPSSQPGPRPTPR